MIKIKRKDKSLRLLDTDFMAIPNNPFILLSYINAQLRDFYPSLESFCEDKNADMNEITEKLSAVGYEYNEELNSFV